MTYYFWLGKKAEKIYKKNSKHTWRLSPKLWNTKFHKDLVEQGFRVVKQ